MIAKSASYLIVSLVGFCIPFMIPQPKPTLKEQLDIQKKIFDEYNKDTVNADNIR